MSRRDELYEILHVDRNASGEDIKHAYRRRAKDEHPDKGAPSLFFSKSIALVKHCELDNAGGDPQRFALIQRAYEILGDPVQREKFDQLAERQPEERAHGGEEHLLRKYKEQGIHCDPARQLVVLCEMCSRPSTKDCFICGMKFCDFCTRKRHWKGKFGLHWYVRPEFNCLYFRCSRYILDLSGVTLFSCNFLEKADAKS